jgi:hypothetical protein
MNVFSSLFSVHTVSAAMPLAFALVLLLILIASFRSRAVVFCQYLQTMTGVKLKPYQVAKAFREQGPDGVRQLFLDLIIRKDLEEGPLEIPDHPKPGKDIAVN